MSSHNFTDTILLHNQTMHGKAADDFLLEIHIPVKINVLCGNLEIIRLAGWVGHDGTRQVLGQKIDQELRLKW
jgi:hypothetical protein